MRRPQPITDLADLLEPEPEPVSEPTQDFAFAPTVHLNDVPDDFPPPSGPLYVNDPDGQTQCMTPLAFPLPPASEDATLDTRARIAFSRVRHAFRRSIDELRELWLAACDAVGGAPSSDPIARATLVAKRARVVWSFWEWDRSDVLRAAAIGSAVFLAVATVGAALVITTESSSSATTPIAEDGVEVRVPRTIDQHTPRAFVLRTKR